MEGEYRTIRLASGMKKVQPQGPIIINPTGDTPANYGPGKSRWILSPEYAGILERICRARFEAHRLIPDLTDNWTEVEAQLPKIPENGDPIQLDEPDEIIATLAQSVYASTKIEGEEVYAEDMPLAIVGDAHIRQKGQDDYDLRVIGTQDTYKAYIWALSQSFPLAGGQTISSQFICELHQRMFSRTKPDTTGLLKKRPNQIMMGNVIVMKMLEPDRVENLLNRLCNRLNSQFMIADNTGRYSKLLAIGEFIVDLLAIHPFDDGNGRIARLLSTYLLERAGFHFARFYSLDSVILDRHSEYYQCLLESQRVWYSSEEDLTPWINFYLSCVFSQWLRAYEEIQHRSAHK